MGDMEAELARFEAELAETTAAHQVTANGSSSLPPPPRPAVPAGHWHPGPSAVPPPFQRPPPPAGPPAWGGPPPVSSLPPPPLIPAQVPAYAPPSYPQPAYQPPPAAYPQTSMPGTEYATGAYPGAQGFAAPANPTYAFTTNPAIANPAMQGQDLLASVKAAIESQKGVKDKKPAMAREAAGTKWLDTSLVDWPDDDFRIFVGDLGNETNDDVLKKSFDKYETMQRVRVVRNKHSNKSKGYGFVSFSDPVEGARALREMDGKYIGNRPCKLRKSSWKDRNQEQQKFLGKRKGGNKGGGGQGGAQKKPILHK